jgi:2-phospho-L-lactate guanylyltransferase
LAEIFVAIPVKKLSESKTRLSSILTLEERQELVRRMLKDVLETVIQSDMVSRILVVCSNTGLEKGICSPKIEMIREEDSQGLNMALRGAVTRSMQRGASSLLILPADIPLIEKDDVEGIIRSNLDRGVVIVPSKDSLGTNALMLTPPDVIHPAFGSDSFVSHISLAKIRGIPMNTLRVERVSLDIDTPEHVRDFLSSPAHGATRNYLLEISMIERLKNQK